MQDGLSYKKRRQYLSQLATIYYIYDENKFLMFHEKQDSSWFGLAHYVFRQHIPIHVFLLCLGDDAVKADTD